MTIDALMESCARVEMMMRAIFKTMKLGERQVFISESDTRNRVSSRQPDKTVPDEPCALSEEPDE